MRLRFPFWGPQTRCETGISSLKFITSVVTLPKGGHTNDRLPVKPVTTKIILLIKP